MSRFPRIFLLFCVVLLSGFCFFPAAFSEGLPPLRTAIHIASTVSDGKYSLDEIAAFADRAGLDAVVFTDRDLMRWEYGLWPLRNIFKKTVEHNSIFNYGVKRYLNDIAQLQKKYPDIVFIDGTESSPYYRWSGSPLRKNLTMHHWHEHLLTIGLDHTRYYRYLPVIGSREGLRKGFAVLQLWPLLLFFCGIALVKKQIPSSAFITILSPRKAGIFLIAVSVIFLINNFPFSSFYSSQHDPEQGNYPYQHCIDYINRWGALSYWAHPQNEYTASIGDIKFITTQHIQRLFQTENYTGFCLFPEGYKALGLPQGIWDSLLLDYCRNKRNKPVWVIAGLAYDQGPDLLKKMRETQTIIFSQKEKKAIIEALRKGRAYITQGERAYDFSLNDFYISDMQDKEKGFMGETVIVQDKVFICIAAGYVDESKSVTITVIKNGKVIKAAKVISPFSITYIDNAPAEEVSYYRLVIEGDDFHLVTNPIFVKRGSMQSAGLSR